MFVRHTLVLVLHTHTCPVVPSVRAAVSRVILNPCFSLTKPQSFADCVGDELPLGWEQVIDYSRGVYYINHVESKYLFTY